MSNHAEQGGEPTTICEILTANLVSAAESDDQTCDDSVNEATYYKAILMGLVFCSMYVLVGVVVDWVGKRSILVVVLAAAGACGVAANLVTDQNLAIALFGIFQMCGACIGMMTAVVVELFPTHLRAMAVSLSMLSGRVGSVLGSNLIGLLISVLCPLSFYLFGGLLILNAAMCLTLPGRERARALGDAKPPPAPASAPAPGPGPGPA